MPKSYQGHIVPVLTQNICNLTTEKEIHVKFAIVISAVQNVQVTRLASKSIVKQNRVCQEQNVPTIITYILRNKSSTFCLLNFFWKKRIKKMMNVIKMEPINRRTFPYKFSHPFSHDPTFIIYHH